MGWCRCARARSLRVSASRRLVVSPQVKLDAFVYSVALSGSGSRLAVGTVDSMIYIFDVDRNKQIERLLHDGLVQVTPFLGRVSDVPRTFLGRFSDVSRTFLGRFAVGDAACEG